jgi:hypothetical protein
VDDGGAGAVVLLVGENRRVAARAAPDSPAAGLAAEKLESWLAVTHPRKVAA